MAAVCVLLFQASIQKIYLLGGECFNQDEGGWVGASRNTITVGVGISPNTVLLKV